MAEKKRLLFVCYGLGIGGIEKCMVNLLNILPEERYDVDVLLMTPQYTLKSQIRRNVRFYDEFDYILYSGGAMEEIRKRGGILRNWTKMFPYVCFRYLDQHGGNGWKIYKKLPQSYDIAIAYSQNGYTPYYVIDKVQAKRKILWYHNGAYDFPEAEQKKHRAYFPQFDQIVAVSQDCAAVLKKKLPYVREKILVLHNICDSESIVNSASAFAPEGFESGRTHIVTVGRMTAEKGALLALEACKTLTQKGCDICWHWVGDGAQAEEVRDKAKQWKLEGRFRLEGNRENPYPYIAAGDLYVQPSFYEAYSTTVTEAKVLNKPMVVTDVGGMRDQLTDEKNALIVTVSAAAIAEAVERLIKEPELAASFSESLQQESYESEALVEAYCESVLS